MRRYFTPHSKPCEAHGVPEAPGPPTDTRPLGGFATTSKHDITSALRCTLGRNTGVTIYTLRHIRVAASGTQVRRFGARTLLCPGLSNATQLVAYSDGGYARFSPAFMGRGMI